MNRVALALGSFMVGVCMTFSVLSPIQTSTRAQAAQGRALVIDVSEPTVPAPAYHGVDSVIAGDVQALDGIDCVRCTISAPLFTYAGGAFSCRDCNLKTGSLQLRGAALNTLVLLQFFGAIPSPPPTQNQPNPNIKRAALQLQGKSAFTLVSLEGVKK